MSVWSLLSFSSTETMIENDHLKGLPLSARDAIAAAQARVLRAVSANDVESIVGASKELFECVAKAALDVLGGTYGSDVSVPKLGHQVLDALKLHPSTLQGRTSLQKLSQSMITAVQAVAELRNTDGTGHGRSAPSNLDLAHALLCRDAVLSWSRWIIAAVGRADRASLDEIIDGISGPFILSRGKLPALFTEIGLDQLGDDDQRRVGLAVARRWSVNGTGMPLQDVIRPIANGEIEYPPAFYEGVLEGLLLDPNGYLQIRRVPDDIDLAVNVGLRIPGHRKEAAFKNLADRVDDARPSYRFDTEAQQQAGKALHDLVGEQGNAAIRGSLGRIAAHIESLSR